MIKWNSAISVHERPVDLTHVASFDASPDLPNCSVTSSTMSADSTKPVFDIVNNNNNNNNNTGLVTQTLNIVNKPTRPFSKESNVSRPLSRSSNDFCESSDSQSRIKQNHTTSAPDSYQQNHLPTIAHQAAETLNTELSHSNFINNASRFASSSISISQISAASTSTPRPYKSSSLNKVTLPQTPEISPVNQTFRNTDLYTPTMRAPSSRFRDTPVGSFDSLSRKNGGGWPHSSIRSFDLPSSATGSFISNGIPLDRSLRINSHSFSSSEDEYNNGYDSDDLMSMGSRRPSISLTFPDESTREAAKFFRDFEMPDNKSKQLEFTIPLPKIDPFKSRNLLVSHLQKHSEEIDNSAKMNTNPDVNEAPKRTSKKRSIANFETAINLSDSSRASSSIINDSKSLRPKAKSFLRISRALEDEMSPFDQEIRQEARVTHSFRTDARNNCSSGISVPNSTHNIKHNYLSIKPKNSHTLLEKDAFFDSEYFKHSASKLLQLNSAYFQSSNKLESGNSDRFLDGASSKAKRKADTDLDDDEESVDPTLSKSRCHAHQPTSSPCHKGNPSPALHDRPR